MVQEIMSIAQNKLYTDKVFSDSRVTFARPGDE
jgi:hypothetical protein